MRRVLSSWLIVLTIGSGCLAQSPQFEWFPEISIFPNLNYDLLENQVYSGIFYLNSSTKSNDRAYVPVNFGFNKNFVQWKWGQLDMALGLGAASYTQFEIELYDSNTLRGGLLNTDFKASGMLFASYGNHRFRLQLFHRSSHLGDDYMLRNQDFSLNDKSLSYEQLDLIYLFQNKNTQYYLGLAEAISPNIFRKRFMIHGGIQGSKPIIGSTSFAYGTDVKVYQENHYLPDVHAGLGLEFNKKHFPQMQLMLDAYWGQLPYSTLDYGNVFWSGLSAVIFP